MSATNSTMSSKRKREEDQFLFVSPDGYAHLVDRDTKKVQWSMRTGDFLWIADRDKDVKDYADLRKHEKGDYKIRLIHHTEDGKKRLVPCDTVELMREYFVLNDSEDTEVRRKPKTFEVDYQTGHWDHSFDPEIGENVEQPQAMIVTRFDFYLHRASPRWSVRFARIEATFPTTTLDQDGQTMGVRRKCTVYHTVTAPDFINFCLDNKIYGFDQSVRSSNPLYNLIEENFALHKKHISDEQTITCLNKKLRAEIELLEKNRKVVLHGTPLREDVDNGISFYKGKYDCVPAAIEELTGSIDIQGNTQNLWNLNYHPNLCAFYGWEFAFDKYYLAYEQVESPLSKYVSMNPYQEMSTGSLNILRGLASAVQHMHSRGLYHGNLSPENIFVQDGTLKIGDLRSTKLIRTPSDAHSDLHAMVHIMLFIMSNGSHSVKQPFSSVTETDIGKLNIPGTNQELYDLFRKLGVLLPHSAATSRFCSPPQIQEDDLLKQMAFLPSAERMRFIKELVDFINDGPASLFKSQMETAINNLVVVPGSNTTSTSDWAAILGPETVEALRKLPNKNQPPNAPSPYKGNVVPSLPGTTVVFELIKLMRNATAHVNSFSTRQTRSGKILADLLGHDVSELEVRFRTTFPSIFVLTYEVVEQYKTQALPSMLLDYF